ncbi:YisL family protein [Gracilibacillus sp. D59]|uniref:YisL family protein n=1 Tax=Gracilibacillus sp. D59 TaxID=3457434 RepID=UPI003FCD1A93
MIHLHITAWVVGLILLIVSYAMYKNGSKAGKIVHMILRLDLILILITGVILFISNLEVYTGLGGGTIGEVVVKLLAGLWVIGSMEMLLVRTSKSKPAKGAWTQLIIALIIVLVLGFGRLPMGTQLFG